MNAYLALMVPVSRRAGGHDGEVGAFWADRSGDLGSAAPTGTPAPKRTGRAAGGGRREFGLVESTKPNR
jgi:hypothetical protein